MSLIESWPNTLGSLLTEFRHNKLLDLVLAKEVGFDTPLTFVVDSFELLKEENGVPDDVYITKSLFNPVSFWCGGKEFSGGATFELQNTKKYKFFSFPSLVQKKIIKEFEVRSFLLDGEFYSMAIFSQRDKKTAVDYRNYNHSRPQVWL